MTLPTGTVTFLFTDIEGSTNHVQELGDSWVDVLERHNSLLRSVIESHEGVVVNTDGDSFFAVFASAVDAAIAATEAQHCLAAEDWTVSNGIRVRMGLHTGQGTLGGDDYVGLDVHRAARIAASGHGGQTVVSEATTVLIERDLPGDISVNDLGKHRLQDLNEPESLFQLTGRGLPDEFPPLRSLDAIPNNLPLQVTSFVGRQQELEEAMQLLEATRVLTLTGPGGTGKTRLALQIGAELGSEFSDGVYFVDLAPIDEEELVPSQILEAVGIYGGKSDMSPAATLVAHVSENEWLLILDNLEHVIGAAPLVAELVKASSGTKVVVTSRGPLRISGEQEYPVPPLSTSGEDEGITDAVRLFNERAAAVRPDFDLSSNRPAVVELVRLLDGLPLAIELVASRVRLLSVQAILDRFDPGDIGSGAVDLPERQRTLDGAIGWSYDLLDDEQRQLFRRLAVFAGSAGLEEIEAVCGSGGGVDTLERLEALADQSLIRMTEGNDGSRFGMLRVIREYAARRLAESDEQEEIRCRHLVFYTEFVEQAADHLQDSDRLAWLDRLSESHDNMRAALEFAIQVGETDLYRRLSVAGWRFWQARGHLHEARRRLKTGLDLAGGELAGEAKTLEALGGVLWWQGESSESRRVYGNALEVSRRVGEPRQVANALYNYALAVGFADQADRNPEAAAEAEAALNEALTIYEGAQDDDGLGNIAWGRGLIFGLLGDDEVVGIQELERSIDFYRRSGNEFGLGWAMFELAWLFQRRGEAHAAWARLQPGFELFARHRDLSAVVLFVALAVGIARDLGDEERAVRLGGVFHTQRMEAGSDLQEGIQVELIDFLSTLDSLTGELGAAYLEGRDMDFDEAVAYVLAGPVDDG